MGSLGSTELIIISIIVAVIVLFFAGVYFVIRLANRKKE